MNRQWESLCMPNMRSTDRPRYTFMMCVRVILWEVGEKRCDNNMCVLVEIYTYWEISVGIFTGLLSFSLCTRHTQNNGDQCSQHIDLLVMIAHRLRIVHSKVVFVSVWVCVDFRTTSQQYETWVRFFFKPVHLIHIYSKTFNKP